MTGDGERPAAGDGERDSDGNESDAGDGEAAPDDRAAGGTDDTSRPPTTGGPIDGQVLVLAAAKASVAADRLSPLVERAATHLRGRRERYRRDYECVHADGDREIYLVDDGHWEGLGATLGFDARETDAVRRAHEEQLRRVGRRTGRQAEFDHALEIRAAVVVTPEGGGGRNEQR